MLKLVSAGLVLCWALCIFLNRLPAELASKGRYTAPPLTSSPAKPAPKGLEWRRVNRLGGRIVAVRLQVILV